MEATISKNTRINLKEEFCAVLKTLMLLEKNYGVNYVVRLLKGDDTYHYRDDSHLSLETFGELQTYQYDKLHKLIHYMLDQQLLKIADSRFGTLAITESGNAFLNQPENHEVKPSLLKTDFFDRMLLKDLKEVRKTLAQQDEKQVYQIFTDYTLRQIVHHKPDNVFALRRIAGIGNYKAERYGEAILATIELINQEKALDLAERNKAKASSPAFQAVKAMLQAGKTVSEIAKQKEVKESSVYQMMYCLHYASEIDLIDWIEENVDQEILQKGRAFFDAQPETRLAEAKTQLDWDYDILKICRFYHKEKHKA